MKAGKVALIVTGALAALLAAALLAAAVWVHNANTDSAGYIVTGGDRVQTVTHAFTSHELDVDSDFDWVLDRGPELRISAESAAPLFVGIAPTEDVERYLAGVEHDEVTDFDVDPFALATERRAGVVEPADPGAQGFWAASVEGTGAQTLDWDGERGGMSIVVMNADGSPGVDAELTLGAHIPHLTWIGLGSGIAGGLLAILAGLLVYLGVRPAPHAPLSPAPPAPAA